MKKKKGVQSKKMFNLKDLASAKNKVKEKREKTAGSAYEEALLILDEFEKNPEKEKLEEAADSLIESLQFNQEHVESYICLAYIFYVLGDDAFAMKYMKIAESFLTELPEDIKNFKDEIEKGLP